MSGYNKENIHIKKRYKAINISNDIKVLILGGGRAAGIKYRSFIKKGFHIDIYCKSMEDEYMKKNVSRRIEFYEEIDFHEYGIIVIATGDREFDKLNLQLAKNLNKLYIYCPDYKKGNMTIPMEVETESMILSIGTKVGSPETSKYLAKKTADFLKEYDEFVLYVGNIRAQIENSNLKKEIMKFMNTDDFYYFFKNGKAEIVLKLFFGDDIIENNCGD